MGKTRHRSLFAFMFLFSVAASHVVLSSQSSLPGGYSPIGNIQDAHIQELGQFGVSEFNKNVGTSAKLTFVRVISGEKQVVAGTKYRLVVEAKEGDTPNQFLAVLWEKPWENFRQLISFGPKA